MILTFVRQIPLQVENMAIYGVTIYSFQKPDFSRVCKRYLVKVGFPSYRSRILVGFLKINGSVLVGF